MENCAVALFTPSIVMTVLNMTMENVADLKALHVSGSNLSVLVLRVPKLRILHIGRN
jgi:hypothetical protein